MNKIFSLKFYSWFLGVVILILGFSSLMAKNYKGAEYRTIDSYLYGRFEVRYKPPAGSGALASFFTYHDFESSSEWNEIDIEVLGRYDHVVQTTSIGPYQKIRPSHQWVNFNPHDDFHVYAFEWTPDYIAWFIDGEEVHRQQGDFISDFQFPQKIMMNIWNQEYAHWSGPWFDENLPLKAYYDYVSYASYTPDSGNCGTNNNFTLQWKDEFDEWDQSRWEKATHTFPGNLCDFVPENVIFEDGYMILCLTDEEHVGGQDVQPPTMLWVWAIENEVFAQFNEYLDSLSATNIANFTIPGSQIIKVELIDKRTVKLTTNGLEKDRSYNLVCLNVKDLNQPPNVQRGQVKSFQSVSNLSLPVRINVGGDSLGSFLADQEWQPNRLYGFEDGYIDEWEQHPEIANTKMDSLFWTARRELVNYRVRLSDGLYRVKLWLAENKFQQAGERVFDVLVNGRTVAANLDLFKWFGFRTAGEITADSVLVTDGLLTLHFTARVGQTVLNAIEIEATSTNLFKTNKMQKIETPLLINNFPNPFNTTTQIQLMLKQSGKVTLEIFDVTGEKLWQMQFSHLSAGLHRFSWNASTQASGLYFLKTTLDNSFHTTNKLLLIK
ncbi:MAG: family 16 glycosylhydrolase [Caldisericaceae bacterium]|nr:family 16 glycosylhydrolase [Caldisericaceae bacterium]